MYRVFFSCFLLSSLDAKGWHKPTVEHFSGHARGTWNHNLRLSYQNQDTGPCWSVKQHEEQKPTTKKLDVTENSVTENGYKPFRDEDEDQQESDRIPEKTFEHLGNKTVRNNKVNMNFCKVHSKKGALEYFTTQNYKLIIPLKEYDFDDIIVKIKNNIVYIKGIITPEVDIDIRFGEDDKNVFEAIYKIPDIVDVKQVSWNHTKGRLEIIFFYKMQFNKEVAKSCDGDYNVDNELRVVRRIDHDAISEIFKV